MTRSPSTGKRKQRRGGHEGLFVANSEMTLGALTALSELQIDVPDALSIVGFDDPLWARHLDPALTVVRQPIVEMAKTATALLLNLLQDPAAIRLEVFPPDLVIRRSTAPFKPRSQQARSCRMALKRYHA
jgi:DNA-binding LacI/PurR family transcriptional regulator